MRILTARTMPVYVVKKGFAEAGNIFIKVNDLNGTVVLYTRTTGFDGVSLWSAVETGDKNEGGVDAQIAQEIRMDPDCWVVEIEDRTGFVDAHMLNEL